jgi:hypothetical protein
MADIYSLEFAQLLRYDPGDVGVTLAADLAHGSTIVPLTAKIDTGSTYCVFERAHGEALGLVVESGWRQRIGTATGSFIAYGHSLTLRTAGLEFDSMVFFAEDEHFNRNILGRFGWLDRVVIGLNDYDGKLYLNRYEPE